MSFALASPAARGDVLGLRAAGAGGALFLTGITSGAGGAEGAVLLAAVLATAAGVGEEILGEVMGGALIAAGGASEG